MVDDLRHARCQPDQGAVLRHDRVRHLAHAGEFRVRAQMLRLAMDRDGDLRPDPLVHLRQLVARRMAGDVDLRVGLVGDDLDAEVQQAVLQSCRSARSLPGMTREEKITTSPFSSAICGCSSVAMRASAARGSPWLPVQISTSLSARNESGLAARPGNPAMS